MIYAFLKALASAITSIKYSIVFALVASSYRHFSRLIPHQEFEYDIYAEILSLAVVGVNHCAVLPFAPFAHVTFVHIFPMKLAAAIII
jgi:hypothetical protein